MRCITVFPAVKNDVVWGRWRGDLEGRVGDNTPVPGGPTPSGDRVVTWGEPARVGRHLRIEFPEPANRVSNWSPDYVIPGPICPSVSR